MPVIVSMAAIVPMFENRLHTGRDCHFGCRLRVQSPADQQHQGGAQERDQRDQPDIV
jgi:hypothetical protein